MPLVMSRTMSGARKASSDNLLHTTLGRPRFRRLSHQMSAHPSVADTTGLPRAALVSNFLINLRRTIPGTTSFISTPRLSFGER